MLVQSESTSILVARLSVFHAKLVPTQSWWALRRAKNVTWVAGMSTNSPSVPCASVDNINLLMLQLMRIVHRVQLVISILILATNVLTSNTKSVLRATFQKVLSLVIKVVRCTASVVSLEDLPQRI